MNKIFALTCLLAAAYAAPAPDADADPFLLAAASPVVYAAGAAPKCTTEFEEITVQSCAQAPVTRCNTQDVVSDTIEYEDVCTDVESNICEGTAAAAVVPAAAGLRILARRDAEADPQFIYTAGAALATPLVAANVATKHVTTVTHPCHKVTTKHCVKNPKVKTITTPVENCHIVNEVKCTDVVNKVPKTICEPLETTHETIVNTPAVLPGAVQTIVNTPAVLPGAVQTILPAATVINTEPAALVA